MISEASLYALGEYFLLSRLSGEVLIFKFKGFWGQVSRPGWNITDITFHIHPDAAQLVQDGNSNARPFQI